MKSPDQVTSLERSNARLQGTVMESARADRFRRCMSFIESKLRQIRRFRYYDMMRFRRLETFTAAFGFLSMMLYMDFRLVVELVGSSSISAIEELVNRRVEETLAAYKATHAANALEAESQSQNDSDGDNKNDGNGNGENGNYGNGNGGNGNPNENDRGARPIARECTYQEFMKCQPLNFKGMEGVVGLISALTWLNSHKRTVGTDAAFAMSWRELMKLMAGNEYYTKRQIQRQNRRNQAREWKEHGKSKPKAYLYLMG
nr:hypothetical protein [Tanacetum cinerariifolium]